MFRTLSPEGGRVFLLKTGETTGRKFGAEEVKSDVNGENWMNCTKTACLFLIKHFFVLREKRKM